jgi:hypothetical protein
MGTTRQTGPADPVRAVHRAEPDPTKVAQALIALAIELAQERADRDLP